MRTWKPIETVPKASSPILIMQDYRRFVAEWDEDSGYFFAVEALDGVEREKYWMEFPGRLYNPQFWDYIEIQTGHNNE